ncbi:MAG: hypothetical protein ACI9XP_001300 [Lentimonas sp.]|jgi:hypothetical protein
MVVGANVYICLKNQIMKLILLAIVSTALFMSCATKKPLTKALKEEYNLTEKNIKQVQFFVSSEIILENSSQKGSNTTNSDGTLVSSSSKEQSRVIILPRTKGVMESYGENGAVRIRFEMGQNKYITFSQRPNMDSERYYFDAVWIKNQGGKVEYGNEEYFATPASGKAYIMVRVKNSQRTKRKDRVVKGMKV